MSAEGIANVLGARKVGAGWLARCPAHDDQNPSLSIKEGEGGRALVYCHAGCDQERVIRALKLRGLWSEAGEAVFDRKQSDFSAAKSNQEATERSKIALAIWNYSSPAAGTLVERYLASRGLRLPAQPALRFHNGLKHPSGGVWPAMVALVTRGVDGAPLAVHRTFLVRDGSGKAPVDPQKMMLGPCRGGAVHLGNPADVLMVGEGIETCLAAMLATHYPAWAALSTSGLRSLDLPDGVRDVIVLADGDDAGEAAAIDAGRGWKAEGRRVRIARPPRGADFNDLLIGELPLDGRRLRDA